MTASAFDTEEVNRSAPHSAVVKVGQILAQLKITPFPRNYELIFEAMSGEHPDLAQEILALGHQPSQAHLDEIGMRHKLAGHLSLVMDATRAQAAQTIEALEQPLNDSLTVRDQLGQQLHRFLDRLDRDPIAGMSEFADETRALRRMVAQLREKEERVATALNETSQALDAFNTGISEARRMALRDSLTGLPNRMALSVKLASLFEHEAQRRSAALVLLSVGGLRTIALKAGRPAAEKVLRQIGGCLRDTIKRDDFIARNATDIFALVVFNVTEANALSIAARIKERIEAMQVLPEQPGAAFLTVTGGLAVSAHAQHATHLLAQAEVALRNVRVDTPGGIMACTPALSASLIRTYAPHIVRTTA
ncbi:hypothetical protein BTR14_14705 [Rhizobium rhizosphaerae]|uniref:GGDEF domain-containing protein n=1 Tax=Xaviernesmea rhizosphaerae TaxID=1672749 RepID=A0ABX3PCB7_9HYPH|nr:GGDEF domain-containing protein [Xaviernesmea rhizosphaerae]OQP85714.1 hypothetical protein BTR14_14705 [Xaviernesmea rhizosphaerae]